MNKDILLIREMIDKIKKTHQSINENNIIDHKSFTDRPDFRSWFGNSKVVDKYGEPLPVYHGSPVGGIEKFEPKHKNVVSSGLKEFGIFFTTSIELAKLYKKLRKLSPSFIEEIENEIDKLKEYRYKIRNNKEYDEINNEIEKLEKKLKGGVYQSYLKIENPFIFDAKGKDGYYGWKELKINIGYKWAIGIDAVEAISGNNGMYESNYDGIIAKNIVDLHLYDQDSSEYSQYHGDVYMVFSPSQIMLEKEF